MTLDEPEPTGFGPDSSPAPTRAVWGVFLAAVALAAAFPLADTVQGLEAVHKRRPADPVGIETLATLAAAVVVAAWVFTFWSLIGSFLNVVVHRLPRGESVVRGGSRCPTCATPIRWHDNLPIVGWLRLGGRCRACGLPISPRYPLVESACAALGTAVYFRELVSGGTNLPGRPDDLLHHGLLRMIPDPSATLVGLYLYHVGLICILLTWGLIAWDRRDPPPQASLTVLVVAAALPLLMPWLHPLDSGGVPEVPPATAGRLAVTVVGGLVGLLVGGLVGGLLLRLLAGDAAGRSGLPLERPRSLAFALMLVGIVLGWQAAVGTATFLLLACLVQACAWSAVPDWPAVPAEILLVPATFVLLCWWRQLPALCGTWWPLTPRPAAVVPPLALAIALSAAMATITPRGGDRHRAPPNRSGSEDAL